MSEILKIGRTNYYSVRKGTQQYRVAEGKRLSDAEYCWQIMKDQQSGKAFFVSGTGVRRWHLPDIYMTAAEKAEEERELRFRRERKANAEKIGEKAEEEEKEEEGEEEDLVGDATSKSFASRDRLAQQMKPLPQWETPEQRRPVVQFARSAIAPFFTQGLLDKKLFAQVIGTATREYCANHSTFTEAEQNALKEELKTMARARMDEEKRKEEFERMNEDLMSKVRRLDSERKSLQKKVEQMLKDEDKMKEELFRLRAHKQDILLHSFKRLTRAGLVQAYWERWIRYKAIVEAQLHVKARQQRSIQMTSKIVELEAELLKVKEHSAKLQQRVQQAEGRDVIAMMMKQAGAQCMARFFHVWKRFAEYAKKDKLLYETQQMLQDCPLCKLQKIELDRTRDRLNRAIGELNSKEAEAAQLTEERYHLMEQRELMEVTLNALRQSAADANTHAASFSQRMYSAEKKLKTAEEVIRRLKNEIDCVRFENADFSGNPARKTKQQQQQQAAGGEGGEMVEGGATRSNPLQLSSFFTQEMVQGETRLGKLVHRSPTKGALNRRGAVEEATEGAIAPLIKGAPRRAVMAQVPTPGRMTSPREKGGKQQLPASFLNADRQATGLTKQYRSPSTSSSSSTTMSSLEIRTNPSSSDDEGDVATPRPPSFSPRRDKSEPTTSQGDEDPEAQLDIDEEATGHLSKAQVEESGRCERCGFKKALAPFCPRDGSRHLFVSFTAGYRDATSLINLNFARSLHGEKEDPSKLGASVLSPTRAALTSTGVIDPKALGLPPGVKQRAQASDATQKLSASLNLDPRQYRQPGFLVDRRGQPHKDSEHDREVADYIRHTRISTESTKIPLRMNQGQDDASESKSVLSMNTTVYGQRPGGAGAAPPSAESRSSWGTLFDFNDVTNGSLGIVTEGVDHVYGVYRGDVAATQSTTSTYRVGQSATPNFTVRR